MTAPVRSFYSINEKLYCEPCSWKEERAAAERGEQLAKHSVVDGSVCARCNTRAADTGAVDFELFKGIPFCPNCQNQIQDWPYPVWLKASLAAVLILLAVALLNGRKYFHAGYELYRGERLVEQGRYRDALPLLKDADDVAPLSDKASLLLAKAGILTGEIQMAQQALRKHEAGHYETSDDFSEVEGLWNRATGALQKADKAAELTRQPGHSEEAAGLIRQAAAEYPEMPTLALAIPYYETGVAFEHKDYDRFLAIAETTWRQNPKSPDAAASVAGALACKYAVTGRPDYRTHAEEMLETARQLSEGNKQEEESYQEYAERFRHRLNTREIIDKQEYDRRFHPDRVGK
jgi:hypothetical protein